MAVEIKELVIRAAISENRENKEATPTMSRENIREIIAVCVEEVLGILRREKER